MAEIICDYDSCKHYENGRCGLDTVKICRIQVTSKSSGGHCRDLDDEQEDFEDEKEN